MIIILIAIAHAVKVTLYIESLCPDTTRFIQSSLKMVTQSDIVSSLDFHFVPFGKATISDGAIKCQHGELECYGNLIQSCAFDLMDNAQSLDFLICIQADRKTSKDQFDAYLSKCAPDFKDEIIQCARGTKGLQLQLKAGEETLALKPKLSFVPTVTIDGEYVREDQDQLLRNMVTYFCQKLQICSK